MVEVDPTFDFGAFAAAADLRAAYFDPARRRAAARLMGGLHAGEGAFVVEGLAGIGKSTLLLEVARELAAVEGVLLLGEPNIITGRSGMTTTELFAAVASRLGLAAAAFSLPACIDALLAEAARRRSVSILLDDADQLPDATLRDLLALTGRAGGDRRLLSVAFCGLPGLAARLSGIDAGGEGEALAVPPPPVERARDLDDAARILRLEPMNEADAARLIRHRLKRNEPGATSFTDEAVALAAAFSGGRPRQLITLCRMAEAYATRAGQTVVGSVHVHAAWADVGRPQLPASPPGALPDDHDREAPTAPDAGAADSVRPTPHRQPFEEHVPGGDPVGDVVVEDRRGGNRLLPLLIGGVLLVAAGGTGWWLARDPSRPLFSSADSPKQGLAGPALGPADAWWRPGAPPPGAVAETKPGGNAALSPAPVGLAPPAPVGLAPPASVPHVAPMIVPGTPPAPVTADRALPVLPPAPPRPGSVTVPAAPSSVAAVSPPITSPAPPAPPAPISPAPISPAPISPAPISPAPISPAPVPAHVGTPLGAPAAPDPALATPPPTPAAVLAQVTPKARPPHGEPAATQPRPPGTPPAAPVPSAVPLATTPRELVTQGDARRQAGDISGARVAYRKAFDAGNTDAAFRLAQTYDPRILPAGRQAGYANPENAVRWYRDAAQKGDRRAKAQLTELAEWLEKRAAAGDAGARRAVEVWQRP